MRISVIQSLNKLAKQFLQRYWKHMKLYPQTCFYECTAISLGTTGERFAVGGETRANSLSRSRGDTSKLLGLVVVLMFLLLFSMNDHHINTRLIQKQDVYIYISDFPKIQHNITPTNMIFWTGPFFQGTFVGEISMQIPMLRPTVASFQACFFAQNTWYQKQEVLSISVYLPKRQIYIN